MQQGGPVEQAAQAAGGAAERAESAESAAGTAAEGIDTQLEEQVRQIDSVGEAIDVVTDKLWSWWDGLVAHLPNLALALLVLGLTALLGRLASRAAERVTRRLLESEALAALAATMIRLVVLAIGFFTALSIVGLERTVTSLLAGAGIIGLAIGFAFQDLAANFLAGVIMGVRQPFAIGDLIRTGDYLGHVEKLNLRSTILRNFAGQRIIIPNKDVFQNALENYSQTGARRIELAVGVHYTSDLDKVRETLIGAIDRFDWLHEDKPVEAWCLSFGDSSIDWSVRYWIRYPDGHGYFDAITDGMLAVKKALDEAGFTIPFPIRTLEVPEGVAVHVSKGD